MIITQHYKIIIYILLVATWASITSLVQVEKRYIWQQDDSDLLAKAMSKPFQFDYPIEQLDSIFSPNHDQRLRTVVRNWGSLQIKLQEPIKPKLTKTAQEKKNQIQKFFTTQLEACKNHAYNRDHVLQEMINWHKDKITLLPEDPQFEAFIQDRCNKKDAKSLYIIATLLDKAARVKSATDHNTYEYQQGRLMEKKVLNIIIQIKKFEHVNQNIKNAIDQHLEYMRWYDQELREYFEVISDPLAGSYPPLPRVRLNWMLSEKDQIILDEKSTIPTPVTKEVITPAPKKIENDQEKKSALEKSAPAPADKNKREILALLNESKRLYKDGHYDDSAQKAWKVIQIAPSGSQEYQRATERFDLLSKKNCSSHIWYMQCVLHKDNPEEAINFFMRAQNLRKETIIQDPETTNSLTFNALLQHPLEIIPYENDELKQAHILMKHLAAQKNTDAIQALATYFHKNASEISDLQLLCLHSAVYYLNQLDPKKLESPLNGCNAQKIYFDYFQQLYVFARKEKNYAVDQMTVVPRYITATALIADAYAHFKNIEQHYPAAKEWCKKALFTYKNHLYKLHVLVRTTLDELMEHNFTIESSHLSHFNDLILEGANGLPLSVKQRKKIIDFLIRRVPHAPISSCLQAKKYQDSPYEKIAIQENKSHSHDFYQMLFALDSGNYHSALSFAKKLSQDPETCAPVLMRNILLSTDLVLKTDAQKLVSIKNVRDEMKSYKQTFLSLPLFSDSMDLLEQMATNHFIPAIELLLDSHLADEYGDYQHKKSLMHHFDQFEKAIQTAPQVPELTYLVDQDFYSNLVFFCDQNRNLDPFWKYTHCLLEALIRKPDEKIAAPIIKRLIQINTGINTYIIANGKDKTFFAQNAHYCQLTNKLQAMINDPYWKKNNNVYGILINLYYQTTEDEAIVYAHQLAELLGEDFGHIFNEFAKNPDADIISSVKTEQQSPNVSLVHQTPQIQNYPNSPQFQLQQEITELRKTKQFKKYKEQKQIFKIQLDNKNLTFHLKIQTLLLMAAHCYMLAQAESDKPLDIFDVQEACAFAYQALDIHPFYGCLAIAHSYIADGIWPQNSERGEQFLIKATTWAEKYRDKLTIDQITNLTQLKTLYRYQKRRQLGTFS